MTRTTFRTLLVAGSIGALGAVASRVEAQAVISGKVLGATQEKLGGAIVTIDELGVSVATNAAGAYAMSGGHRRGGRDGAEEAHVRRRTCR